MNINVRPAAAAEWADDNFAGARMRHRENGRVYARKFQNEITRHQLRRDLLVRPLRRLMHTDWLPQLVSDLLVPT